MHEVHEVPGHNNYRLSVLSYHHHIQAPNTYMHILLQSVCCLPEEVLATCNGKLSGATVHWQVWHGTQLS